MPTLKAIRALSDHPALVIFCRKYSFQKQRRRTELHLWTDAVSIRVSVSRDGRTVYFECYVAGRTKVVSINRLLGESTVFINPRDRFQAFERKFVGVLDDAFSAYEKIFVFYLEVTGSTLLDLLTPPDFGPIESCFDDRTPTNPDVIEAIASNEYVPFYYALSISEDPSVMGVEFPQINGVEEEMRSLGTTKLFDGHINEPMVEELMMKSFLMNVDANHVDFFSSAYLRDDGFFVSSSLSSHTMNWRLSHCRVYSVDVNKRYPGKRSIKFLHVPEQRDLIDFNLSTFIQTNYDGVSKIVSFSDSVAMDSAIANTENQNGQIFPNELYLNAYPDLVKLPNVAEVLISIDFLKLLQAKNFVGYTIHDKGFRIF